MNRNCEGVGTRCAKERAEIFEMRYRVIFFVLSLVGFSHSASTVCGQEPPRDLTLPAEIDKPSVLTFEELRDGIRRRYADIQGLEVEYVQTIRPINLDIQVVPACSCHFALKGEKRLRSTAEIADGKQSASGASIYAFDESSVQEYLPGSSRGRIKDPIEKPTIIDQDPYAHALAIPLSDLERASVASTDYLLPYALDVIDSGWKVQPKLSLVDGAECHVLESRFKQRIWVDPTIGFAIRFREIYQRIKGRPANEWPLQSRREFRDFQKMSAAVWLPRNISIESFNSAKQPEDRWNQPSFYLFHRVSKLALNDEVSDSLFTIRFPVGTVVRDRLHDRYYRIGSANEELDILVAESQRALDSAGFSRRTWWIVANAVIIALLAALLAYRTLKQRRSSG